MRIRVINPNSSLPMTRAIEATAREICADGTVIEACCPPGSPLSIEGHSDGVLAAHHMLKLVEESGPADGFVVACFDDTGVDGLRERVSGPVLGIGEAAMHAATMLACRFSILTTLKRSIPIIEDNASRYGLGARCKGVHAANIPVLALENENDDHAFSVIREAAAAVLEKDGSDALVLGCGGMTHFARRLGDTLGIPVVDGVSTAVKFVEALVGLGLKTGKTGGYAFPLSKTPPQTGKEHV
ncbi:aspartate/glutamate racemase family protein [Pseudodesulfovibrio thermohalotolerans]|uniref:aspartate/glutamate racemase family protein n=1 Tax=Pseudodesulfovibrio thermohalotolerans TaxID=2880651 RepID=UPI0024423EF1|nr:aspartate/glutamate racemase family protein [Pseudodesulfovibrio thermohalotolerans]WFS63374.1 aspartate/glutamate racemase family protein [Pseudodesulfovibrio thermohalotolerans]